MGQQSMQQVSLVAVTGKLLACPLSRVCRAVGVAEGRGSGAARERRRPTAVARGGAPAGVRTRAGGSEAEGHTSSEASDEAPSLVARWGTCLCGRQAQRGPAGAGARAGRRERRRVRNKRAAKRSRERQEAMDAVDFEEVAALRGVLRELTAEVATLRAQAEEDRQRGDGPVASESISEQMRAAAADARVKSAEGRLLEASAKLEVTQKALQRSRSDLEAARAGEAAARAAGEAARDRAEGMARELALAKRDTARLARAEVRTSEVSVAGGTCAVGGMH